MHPSQARIPQPLAADRRLFDAFSFVNVSAFLRFSYTDDDMVQSWVSDEQALQILMPVNVDHGWSADGGLTYGRPIRPLGAEMNVKRGFDLLDQNEGVTYTSRASFIRE